MYGSADTEIYPFQDYPLVHGALALTLSLFSFAVYHHFNVRLYGDLDALLISRSEGITDAIDMFWKKSGERHL